MENSRTKNSIYNFISSIGGQFLNILLQFIVRTVFIKTLGEAYLGVTSLFSNILSMLSITEFGVGSAILFKLYQPIANHDEDRICSLMQFYKTVYRVIGFIVIIIGFILIPFLPVLIKDYDSLEKLNINAIFVFAIFLFRSAASYLFFAYKNALIKANQKEYLITVVGYFVHVISSILQIVCLLVFKNFYSYVIISVVQVIFANLVYAHICNKMYPYVNKPVKNKVSKEEATGIFKDCAAIFLYNLNEIVLKATDNIVLSAFTGLTTVALYSNYYIFYTTISTLFSQIFNSVAHSLGNLHTDKNKEHEYLIFETMMLITSIVGGTAAVGIGIVADEFITCWIGESWVISAPFSILLGIELYTLAVNKVLEKYRTTMGLFQKAKWRPVAGMIINLAVSIVLVQVWGICGVLVGTIVSEWLTLMWYDPIIIYRYGFRNNKSVLRYFKMMFKFVLEILIVALIDTWLCRFILVDFGYISVIAHTFICVCSVPGVMLFLSRNKEGKLLINLFNCIITRKH